MPEAGVVDIKISNHPCGSSESCVAGKPGNDFIQINYSGNIDAEETTNSRMENEELIRIIHQTKEKVVVVANGVQQVRGTCCRV